MTDSPISLDDWVARLSAALDVPDGIIDRDLVLDLARDAAHAVARPAAPLTTFLVGYAAARGDGSPETIRRLADVASALARDAGTPPPD